MKSAYLAILFFSVFLFGARPEDPFPQAFISNGIISARLYLPDVKQGYYRGTRFDWAGVIPELQYKDHSYFGQWFEKYSPTLHDAIMGPVEDFFPIGYDEAKPGETFLKIGIGMVQKPVEAKYFFANTYQLINAGDWKVKPKKDRVQFIHTLNDKEYGYEYRKTVQLTKGKPELVLLHSLENTGKKLLETNVYNHNFFMMDNHPIGPDYVVSFPFDLTGEARGGEVLGRLEKNQILFSKDLTKNDHLFYGSITGFGDSAKDYDIKIENQKTGAAVRITCDQPLNKLVFWSAIKTVCPEPYIHVKVNPGETFTWKISYQFYICDIKK